VGYVRLARFSVGAGKSLADAIDSLRSNGAKKFIVDLRGNSGGLLNQAIEVSEVFLDRGEEIVSTRGRLAGSNRKYLARNPSIVSGSPLIVLVNSGSASASEILSGTIQDWDRGLVAGVPTYGKGSVQTIIPMSDGTALRLTTAEWYTPSGRLINKERESEDTETAEEDSSTSLIEREIFHTVGGLNRIVYGGGGITPDLELEQDTPTDFETQLIRDRRLFEFAIKYTKTKSNIERPFKSDESVMREFKSYLKENEVAYSEAQLDSSLEFISRMIEQEVSGTLWGMSGRYEANLRADPWIERAISLLDMSQGSADLFALAEQTRPE
jgi:carboxyl-terminal processing protease